MHRSHSRLLLLFLSLAVGMMACPSDSSKPTSTESDPTLATNLDSGVENAGDELSCIECCGVEGIRLELCEERCALLEE